MDAIAKGTHVHVQPSLAGIINPSLPSSFPGLFPGELFFIDLVCPELCSDGDGQTLNHF